MDQLHKDAFWVYGVIVGLAIREVLSHVVPDFISRGWTDWWVQLEVWRSLVFVLIVIQFYLGSSLYFSKVYFRRQSATQFVKRSYPIDFLCGLVHFLVFFVWSITSYHVERARNEVSYFTIALAVVLLYDNVWYIASELANLDTTNEIKPWRDTNHLAFIACLVVYLLVRLAFGMDPVFTEHMILYPAAILGAWDLLKILSGYKAQNP